MATWVGTPHDVIGCDIDIDEAACAEVVQRRANIAHNGVNVERDELGCLVRAVPCLGATVPNDGLGVEGRVHTLIHEPGNGGVSINHATIKVAEIGMRVVADDELDIELTSRALRDDPAIPIYRVLEVSVTPVTPMKPLGRLTAKLGVLIHTT